MTRNSLTQYDVIIVGSGVMGSAIAYHLIKQNEQLKIALIERDTTFAKSSTVLSDGNIRIQFNLPVNIKISLYGLKKLETFSEEMAIEGMPPVEIGFRQQGNLFIIDEKGAESARVGFETQLAYGGEVEWLNPAQIKAIYPIFNPAACVGGTLGPKDGTMSPLDILLGYRRKALSLGVQAINGNVVGLLHEKRAMRGVRLASHAILSSPVVVTAAGVWATELLRNIGVDLPIRSIKREVYAIASETHFDHILPVLLLPNGQYVLHEGGSHFITGGAGPNDRETTTDFSWSKQRFEDHFWERLIQFMPSFDRLKLVNGWAGFYAMNHFDSNAIIGEWPEMKGLFLANGFSGHGFQQCHGVGRYLADLILGASPALDLSDLSPTRILENKPLYENPARLI